MERRERHVRLFCIGLTYLILVGCGSTPAPPPPSPSFAISFSPASVTLVQGGVSQPVQVSVTSNNGFAGSCSVPAVSLPAGLRVSPATLFITPNSPATFHFSASSTTGIAQQSISVN